MKRSAPLVRKTPLKSGGLKRDSWKSSPVRSSDWRAELRSGGMKRRAKKPTVVEGKRFIDACRGEECYLLVPGVCCSIGWAHDSVVDCHSNQLRHGKGKGIKADNEFTVPGCGPCHYWIDFGKAARELKFATWDRAYECWEPVRARKMGLKEEEGAVLDSNTDGHALAHASRPQRKAVCIGAVSTDIDARDDCVSARSAEGAERDRSIRMGGRMDSRGSEGGNPDPG